MKALVLLLKNVIFCTYFIANIKLAGLKTTARDEECKKLIKLSVDTIYKYPKTIGII